MVRVGLLAWVTILVACSPMDAAPEPIVEESAMLLTSPVFAEGGSIPRRYTCDGDDVSPPLEIQGVPEGAGSLVLIMDDPDAPRGVWDHWVVYDIPPDVTTIPEGVESLGTSGRNSWGRLGYGGPCPPSGVHRYVFQVFALDGPLGLREGATKARVLEAAEPRTLARARLVGRYGRG